MGKFTPCIFKVLLGGLPVRETFGNFDCLLTTWVDEDVEQRAAACTGKKP
jgi:hypothetical protein